MPRRLHILLFLSLLATHARAAEPNAVAARASVLFEGKHVASLVALSPDGHTFTYAPAGSGRLKVADRRSRRVLFDLPVAHALECHFTPDGSRLVVVRLDERADRPTESLPPATAEVRDSRTGRLHNAIRLGDGEPAPRRGMAGWHVHVSDAALLVPRIREAKPHVFEVSDRLYRSTPPPSVASVYDLRNGTALGGLRGEGELLYTALSADGRTFVGLDATATVHVYDTATRKAVRDFARDFAARSPFAVSGDGKHVAIGSVSGALRVCNNKGFPADVPGTRIESDDVAFAGDGSAFFVSTASRYPVGPRTPVPWMLRLVPRDGKKAAADVVPTGTSADYKSLEPFGPLLPGLVSRDGRVILAADEKAGVLAAELPPK